MSTDAPPSPRRANESASAAGGGEESHDARTAPFYGYPGPPPPGYYGYPPPPPPPGYGSFPPPFPFHPGATAFASSVPSSRGGAAAPPPSVGWGVRTPSGWDPRTTAHSGAAAPPYGYGAMPTYPYPSSTSASRPLSAASSDAPKDKVASGTPEESLSHASESFTPKTILDLEAERMKNSEQELTLSEVDPIKTDFHWFVLAIRDTLRPEAEKEVQASLSSNPELAIDSKALMFLINTNLNSRLMRAWEDLPAAPREFYIKKEEEDRRRFQEEDEVASRHCATLTSRTKSPLSPPLSQKKESPTASEESGSAGKPASNMASEDRGTNKRDPDESLSEDASPLKKNRIAVDGEEDTSGNAKEVKIEVEDKADV